MHAGSSLTQVGEYFSLLSLVCMCSESNLFILLLSSMWGISSDGRAPALHAGGTGIDTQILQCFFLCFSFCRSASFFACFLSCVLSNVTTCVMYTVSNFLAWISFCLYGRPSQIQPPLGPKAHKIAEMFRFESQ